MKADEKDINKTRGLTYADSGVSIDAGDSVVSRIKDMARATFTAQTLSDIGSFGALYEADFPGISKPALVSSADGVGTKLKVAFMTGQHGTVGEDLVNHCVNDILVQGARPLFFMDYFATGALSPDTAVEVISGVARGCKNAGAAFIGGETAEMPDIYSPGEYDLAGFIVGVVDKNRIVDGSGIRPGDKLIGIASNGLHTNGYSLARKAIFTVAGRKPDETLDSSGMTIGEALLRVHTCYLAPITEAMASIGDAIHGMAHITGGGIAGNLSRIIPDGIQASVTRGKWPIPKVFDFIQQCGDIAPDEMYRAFNMGIGYIAVIERENAEDFMAIVSRHNHKCYELGVTSAVAKGDEKVRYV